MLRALGLDEGREAEYIARADARHWTHFPRDRLLISTIPVGSEPWTPDRRPPPWESGWSLHPEGQAQPMM
eukprot:7754835-Lingulodinium_polyedra.AAC.1